MSNFDSKVVGWQRKADKNIGDLLRASGELLMSGTCSSSAGLQARHASSGSGVGWGRVGFRV